ncbi:hypothetical protein GJ25_gp057 [Mycobacterium phage Hawkeye]|uniref:Uncharacterized protein n=1 Tax=Mycobacterium phage Hawkeye TaxID=1458711 RepID=X2KRI8_9CAUD|nr:hypothetical protein GJ25_gp057 [Mycobacterium phage Hawkeye]AHN84068.1 hypothetical protein PBI_HAWKEYE_57 [Mycobacterium phage Hawkeye]
MSTFDLIFVTAALSGSSMYLLAWRIHRNHPTVQQIEEYMDRHLRTEEIEFSERQLLARMARANRAEVPRINSGGTARISRMHVVREGRNLREN